ncbi:MAG: saccharopine dehydrogenase C-terminal domain-containing protein [Bacillota bacterium]|nr:saccharopine dehydrogenase C-terminal domain-containing protein [Bacillota bacterium]MDW7678576.1 saccharopine dehydrogenase C-terminal domain-containing protein [Bacillota bacterium]
MRVIVLGGGLVGGVMAKDLAGDGHFEVAIADRDEAVLQRLAAGGSITGIQADLSDGEAIKKLVKDYDLVIGAVPGFLGRNMLQAVIEAGKNIADISSWPGSFQDLDDLAKRNGVTAVVDCGVAPGLSSMLVGYAASLLDKADRAEILVGGLPVVREWPYEYKIVFSAVDVIQEYCHPARVVENGRVMVRPALSELELVDLPGVGTVEAFLTDGLCTLPETMTIPHMKEKTLRYPGHAERMRMLRETGFFSEEPIRVKGVEVKPVDVAASLLFPAWELKEGEKELTVMRVEVEGVKNGRKRRYRYDLLDHFDEATGITSMARTTGYPCVSMARLIAAGKYTRKGICLPEFIGQDQEVFHGLMAELKTRGIEVTETVIGGRENDDPSV